MLRRAVVVVIEDDFGRVLLAKRAAGDTFPGVWNPISGEVEQDETLEAAALRETREEIGLEITLEGRFFESTTTRRGFILYWFRAHISGGALSLDQAEIEEVAWVGPEELASCSPKFRDTEVLLTRYWRGYARNPY